MRIGATIFDIAGLSFACFWHVDLLARDFDLFFAFGVVQADALAMGHDTPSGFFFAASRVYTDGAPTSILARRALMLTAMRLEESRPS